MSYLDWTGFFIFTVRLKHIFSFLTPEEQIVIVPSVCQKFSDVCRSVSQPPPAPLSERERIMREKRKRDRELERNEREREKERKRERLA